MRLFRSLLEIDSTSGKERGFSDVLATVLPVWFDTMSQRPEVSVGEVGDGTVNLLFSWGEPQVVFCTHVDTVPPYIPPTFIAVDGSVLVEGREDRAVRVCGRGSNDAKGQIFAMAHACKRLAEEGATGFGLLLVSGEETGSFGAKAFAKTAFRAPYLIVGEPTGNRMVSASKGTKSYKVTIGGRSCHSGYPEHGVSAVDIFRRFMDALDEAAFPEDGELGATTWNVGKLESPNPQNILSDCLGFRIYFRTTFASDAAVCAKMEELGRAEYIDIEACGGDVPRRYMTLPGFGTVPVSFGSDAPHLDNFARRAIYGPGDILTAHTSEEYVEVAWLEQAVQDYVSMFHTLKKETL